MSVVPNRGTRGRRTLSGLRTRRPARGFGQKKDSSLGKPPSRSTRKKRLSISDAFKRAQERRNERKIKRDKERKLRQFALSRVGKTQEKVKSTKKPIRLKISVDPKRPPKRPKTPTKPMTRQPKKGKGF
tara:strand:- start:43 stop:429 length:387 start_codon:yes stop_codon:yes gene_type:complete